MDGAHIGDREGDVGAINGPGTHELDITSLLAKVCIGRYAACVVERTILLSWVRHCATTGRKTEMIVPT